MSITSKTDWPVSYMPNTRPLTKDALIGASAAAASYALRDTVHPLIALPVLFLAGEWATWAIAGYSTRFSQAFFEAPDLILDSGTFNSNVQLVHKFGGDGSIKNLPFNPPVQKPDYDTPRPYKFHASALG